MVSKKLPYDTNGLPYDIYMGDSRPQCSHSLPSLLLLNCIATAPLSSSFNSSFFDVLPYVLSLIIAFISCEIVALIDIVVKSLTTVPKSLPYFIFCLSYYRAIFWSLESNGDS